MVNSGMVIRPFLALLWLLCNASGIDAKSRSLIWCPESYRAMEMKGFFFHVCLPMSCAKITSNSDNAITLLNNNDTSSSHCQPFTENFKTCQKTIIGGKEYTKASNYAIYNKLSKSYVQHGEYFFQSGEVIVCLNAKSSQTTIIPMITSPKPCLPFEVPKSDYKWLKNDTVFISSINGNVTNGYYQLDDKGLVIRVCYQTDFPILDCKTKTIIHSKEMTVLSSMALNTSFVKSIVYPLGHYMLVENRDFALVCVNKSTPVYQRDITVKMYGGASLISAVCLLLALLVHLFFPNLNYHTRTLLCLAFSLFVMYTVICIRNFGHQIDFTRVGNMVIFAFQYTFALSSFLWLNVVAFDLWRVFSNQKAPAPSFAIKKKGKRLFVIKCAYAFGIPALLCAGAIGISFNKTIQQRLNIYMVFDNNNWFQGEVSTLTLFYGPVLAILVSNAIFFGLTVKNIRKVRSGSAVLRSHTRELKVFKVYIKLFVIMGLPWFAEIIYWFAKDKTDETVWYVTDLINTLQGVFIFLVYVCKKKTLIRIKEKFKRTATKTVEVSCGSKSTRLTSQRVKGGGGEPQRISIISLTPISRNEDIQQ